MRYKNSRKELLFDAADLPGVSFTWCWIFFVSGILLFSIALSYLIDTMISVLLTMREVNRKNKPAAAESIPATAGLHHI